MCQKLIAQNDATNLLPFNKTFQNLPKMFAIKLCLHLMAINTGDLASYMTLELLGSLNRGDLWGYLTLQLLGSINTSDLASYMTLELLGSINTGDLFCSRKTYSYWRYLWFHYHIYKLFFHFKINVSLQEDFKVQKLGGSKNFGGPLGT